MRVIIIFLLLLTGTLSFGQTPDCNALKFDGSNDYVTIPYINEYNIGTGEFTIEAWVISDSVSFSIPCILSNRLADHNTGFHFTLLQWQSGTSYYDGNVAVRLETENLGLLWNRVNSIQDTTFHHVAVRRTFGSTVDTVTFFNEGKEIHKVTTIAGLDITTSNDLTLGWDRRNSTRTAFLAI